MGLFDRLKEAIQPEDASARDPQRAQRIAAAVLLLEMAHADNNHDSAEYDEIRRLLKAHFGLSDDEVAELIDAAAPKARTSVSLYEYLKTLNDGLDVGEKREVLEMLWRVAYADNELDAHEEGLLRDLADLLYLPHEQFLKAKFRVTGESI
ncbi:TerB family tellurite resistance protein [Salinisphaera sp.]|uniref:tellurite resistance TerB family protein n=1 Tax=Salinisphaera sp. TaxID=1914330 RepID=UPI002D778D64|nr:TerB family tellurite resistance protein [Salinisphaera sp.]HET7315101.1 TerB family tellurite resistance protein [Salinisphaera sp.]